MLGDKGELAAPDVSESRRICHSADLSVGEGTRACSFADKVGVYNVWHTLWRTTPAQDFTVTRRNTFFQINPDSPLAVFRWQISITALRDLPNNGFRIALLRSEEDHRYGFHGSDGATLTGEWGKAAPGGRTGWITLPFSTGAYAALLDSPLGGAIVYPLTDGLQAGFSLPERNTAQFNLPAALSPQKKGETKTVELLLVGIPRPTELPNGCRRIPCRWWNAFPVILAWMTVKPATRWRSTPDASPGSATSSP